MRVRRHNGLSDDESMAPNDFWEFKSHLVPQQSESAAPLLVQENTNPVTPVKNDLEKSNVSPIASTSKELLGLLCQDEATLRASLDVERSLIGSCARGAATPNCCT